MEENIKNDVTGRTRGIRINVRTYTHYTAIKTHLLLRKKGQKKNIGIFI
jgi:hypothetical protein